MRFLPLMWLSVLSGQAVATLPDYPRLQLQARSNLLINDEGFNLPPGASFNSISADLDGAGRVSFPVQVVPSGASSRPGVWFGAEGSGGLVFEGPVDALISSDTSHNASGAIVFTLSETGSAATDGLYRYDLAAMTATRLGTAPIFPNSYANVRINTVGAVGYQAVFGGGRGLGSTLSGSSVLHAVDRNLDPGSAWTFLYSPDFNDQRRIAIKLATSSDFTTATEIRAFASDGASVRLAANQGTDPASALRQFDNGLSFNDLGQVAFIASRTSDQRRGVYLGDGSSLTEVIAAQPGAQVTELDFFRPVLNNLGQMVFRGRDSAGMPAIFVAEAGSVRRLVGRGDALQTDLGLAQIGQNNLSDPVFSGNPVINDRGDVVFIAALHPQGNNQIEWGTGVFIAYAETAVFRNGFEACPTPKLSVRSGL